jgi:hypothetical protein
MAKVHAAGGLTARNFRGDVAHAVRVIAGRDLRGEAGPRVRTGYNATNALVRR